MEFASLSVRTRLFAAALVSLGLLAGLVAYSAAPASGAATAVEAAKKGKKKKKKKKRKKPAVPAPVPVAPAPTPLPLTGSEVVARIVQQADAYCATDEFCLDFGYYGANASTPECSAQTTYQWVCYGWNDEDYEPEDNPDGVVDTTCDFREVVSRVGLNGITSSQDLTYGDEGWDCFPFEP